jgi:5-methylcytosine-specific restriction endonuclease McrA
MKDAATAAQRGQCCEPGCDARPNWLQADHIIPWTPNDPGQPPGPTATHNLQMLCGSGNHAKSNRPNPPPPTPPARAEGKRPPRSEAARPRHGTRRTEPSGDRPALGSRAGDSPQP